MIKKRHRRRLRKQVIFGLPIATMIGVLAVSLVLNRNIVFSSEVKTSEKIASENEIYDGPVFSDLEFIKNIDKSLEKRRMDNTVIYYAQTFKLDVDKTLEIAHKLTNNYENKDYQKHHVIANKKWIAKLGSFNSFEAGVVYFVRDLYRYPERYGSTIEEIRESNTITTKQIGKNRMIYMDNGLTFEQYVGKIADLLGVDKNIALAISYQEAGIKSSNLFKNSNNIGGHRGYNGWMKYTTLEAGVIAHIVSIKSIADKNNIDLSTHEGLRQFSGVYVNGSVTKPQDSWVEKVSIFTRQIKEKDLFTIKK